MQEEIMVLDRRLPRFAFLLALGLAWLAPRIDATPAARAQTIPSAPQEEPAAKRLLRESRRDLRRYRTQLAKLKRLLRTAGAVARRERITRRIATVEGRIDATYNDLIARACSLRLTIENNSALDLDVAVYPATPGVRFQVPYESEATREMTGSSLNPATGPVEVSIIASFDGNPPEDPNIRTRLTRSIGPRSFPVFETPCVRIERIILFNRDFGSETILRPLRIDLVAAAGPEACRAGVPCGPFQVWWTADQVQYPLKAVWKARNCPATLACQPGEALVFQETKPIVTDPWVVCPLGSGGRTVELDVRLSDAAGNNSDPFTLTKSVYCSEPLPTL
jgi:hypothetical protein